MLKRCLLIVFFTLLLFLQSTVAHPLYADTDEPSTGAVDPSLGVGGGSADPVVLTTDGASGGNGGKPDSGWAVDADVTTVGKSAARAGLILDWTLQNYNWACVHKIGTGQCDNSNNPLQEYSKQIIFYIVMPILFTMILVSAGVIITTRGRNLTITRFIPRFVIIVLLVFFSFAFLKVFYEGTDALQGWFLASMPGKTCPPACISQKDLLFVGWNYKTFTGLKLLGNYHAESVNVSLWLIKLTTWTYSVMIGILLLRKIILWFFIIVAPIFPLLLLYGPTRNTAKIWVAEFFRWLLYAPLFAIFLQGLVFLWQKNIPLWFSNPYIGNEKEVIFPTAINILMAGPKQLPGAFNSLNLPETFILYVVALLMLWVAIILPWILLQVFLSYATNFSPGESTLMKTLINTATLNKPSKAAVVPGVNSPYSPKNPSSPGSGSSKGGESLDAPISLPFAKKFAANTLKTTETTKEGGQATTNETTQQTNSLRETQQSKFAKPIDLPQSQVRVQALSLAQVPLPSMRDIAKYDTALMTSQTQALAKFQSKAKPPEAQKSDIISQNKELIRVRDTLMKIANPDKATSPLEHDRYVKLRERLEKESQQGNLVASSIMNAVKTITPTTQPASPTEIKNVLSQIANPASATSTTTKETIAKVHEALSKESTQNNNELARAILSVNTSTSDVEIEKITEKIHEGQAQNSPVALSVLSTINEAQLQNQQTVEVKNALQQIANPEAVKDSADKEQVVKIRQSLDHASHQGNEMATAILAVNAKTADMDIEKLQAKIKELTEQGDPLATEISSSILASINNAQTHEQSLTQVKDVFQQIISPETVKDPNEKEHILRVKDSLSRASQQGNGLAKDILSINKMTSTQEIEKLQEKINALKEQKDPLATELASLMQKATQNIPPAINRVQTVAQEDYEAVKSMWKDNYMGFEVVGNRTDWISDDIARIDKLIELLLSQDDQKINQGLREIAELLPFLLVGGFSLGEIVAYLKAKRDAAEEALNEIRNEDEQKIPAESKAHTENTQEMATPLEAKASPEKSADNDQ